jgi:hypothetical protein
MSPPSEVEAEGAGGGEEEEEDAPRADGRARRGEEEEEEEEEEGGGARGRRGASAGRAHASARGEAGGIAERARTRRGGRRAAGCRQELRGAPRAHESDRRKRHAANASNPPRDVFKAPRRFRNGRTGDRHVSDSLLDASPAGPRSPLVYTPRSFRRVRRHTAPALRAPLARASSCPGSGDMSAELREAIRAKHRLVEQMKDESVSRSARAPSPSRFSWRSLTIGASGPSPPRRARLRRVSRRALDARAPGGVRRAPRDRAPRGAAVEHRAHAAPLRPAPRERAPIHRPDRDVGRSLRRGSRPGHRTS